ncbi:hypothetical protein A2715_00255 [Candidatus Woesebacteria bacterium RIFCSPHIGHO2_01_FULL_39_32]|uniref:Uncharacterized protein n=2 Tax=Candidatus Woeseibacteriota TaxID=1752722 RepID=A0A0G0PRT8_9BACT|nr:MAG: hypothetical protein UT61_C0004G0030 [Candidatus Woesebacteria bacterium GW2011_GWA1_39_8]OGM03792.1 MAG: hypothetical protein A2124_00375 [Candidatus Woesebacteria bacterium GWB1_37_5]OGM24257.1 MAG: hypothetical protein A2715_00255 [Candidatus Woesebacteria bacterium RIFCSPHIGHO2_01_FULL_39_32]OGM35384.1 MAG: hypothetical protein A3F01_04610 [Candidatus Woesebacteria bacterium RIFCSPHIGHO2_12_FULL_38_11]OGM65328.1 MAG: hypothetical protein A2893_01210 [Candidatus Woesebacteria bacteri
MAIVKEYLSPITQIDIDPQSKEGLIHGGKLDVTSLLLERFSTYGERINEAFAEIINQGGTFHLFGNTLILNLGPEIEVIDFRDTASYFASDSLYKPVYAGRDEEGQPLTLIGLINNGVYNRKTLLKIAGQIRRDLDLSLEGLSLDEMQKILNSHEVVSSDDRSISTPNLKLLRIVKNHPFAPAQITIIRHNDKESYRTPPGINLDIAHADISLENGRLVASLDDENQALIGYPPTIRIINWQQLEQKRLDQIIARGLRHAHTIIVNGNPIDLSSDFEEYGSVLAAKQDFLRRASDNDPSIEAFQHEIAVAVLGAIKSNLDRINW